MAAHNQSLRDALISLYVSRWRALHGLLSRHTRSSDIAEDALQETWFRLERMGADSDYVIRDRQAFILRVASNIAIDILRRERRISGREIRDEELLIALADQAPGPETIVSDRQQLRQLAKALSALPPNARQALLLSRIAGLSHSEIAIRLSVSNSMVAKYLAQALRHCRDHFRQMEGPK